jgi:RNA polymerase sigma factor (sigma-70 family)
MRTEHRRATPIRQIEFARISPSGTRELHLGLNADQVGSDDLRNEMDRVFASLIGVGSDTSIDSQDSQPTELAQRNSPEQDSIREVLYRDLRPLVDRLKRRTESTRQKEREFEHLAYEHFCRHLAAFDPARNVPLRPYLVRMLSLSLSTGAINPLSIDDRNRTPTCRDCDDSAIGADSESDCLDVSTQPRGAAILANLLTRLPADQQRIVSMHYYEHMTMDEIGGLLATPPSTVRSIIHGAVKRLRMEIIRPWCNGQDE